MVTVTLIRDLHYQPRTIVCLADAALTCLVVYTLPHSFRVLGLIAAVDLLLLTPVILLLRLLSRGLRRIPRPVRRRSVVLTEPAKALPAPEKTETDRLVEQIRQQEQLVASLTDPDARDFAEARIEELKRRIFAGRTT